MYRYAEGAGTAARFNFIRDLDFLSSTELICTDQHNHCLRLVDFMSSPPETSAFAGNCTARGNVIGHRLNSALFDYPKYTEITNNSYAVFMLDGYNYNRMVLHKIDLRTNNVTVIVTFDVCSYGMKLIDDTLLYLAQDSRVTVFNLNTREEIVVAGGDSSGRAIGPFEHTRFDKAFGLLPWRNEVDIFLLVADRDNKRFADSFIKCKFIPESILELFDFTAAWSSRSHNLINSIRNTIFIVGLYLWI